MGIKTEAENEGSSLISLYRTVLLGIITYHTVSLCSIIWPLKQRKS